MCPITGGKPLISEVVRTAIRSYLEENSNIASNRLVKGGLPARYLTENKTELFKGFRLNKEISNITFNNYLKKTGEFKKPHR
jgi:metal-responsive CopG/Arc/MetJ family transcriptional regulator